MPHSLNAEIEKCTNYFKVQVEEEQKEIEQSQKKVTCLLSSLYKKNSVQPKVENLPQDMKISLPDKSILSSLFKEERTEEFFFKHNQEDKRKRLAAERRAEYNAYLEKKESELNSRKKMLEEVKSVTPKSILESVDYDKVLARLKAEESKFRNINYAEPSLEENFSNHEIPPQEIPSLPPKMPISDYTDISTSRIPKSPNIELEVKKDKESRYVQNVPKTPLQSFTKEFAPAQRTGGGGEPVRDSYGNLITARGFKADLHSMGYPPLRQDVSQNKKDFYREELRKQIEEKKQMAALEKERARLLEEQIAQRIEEQRQKMLQEYENELKKNNLIKEQRQKERLQKLEEFQRREIKQKELEIPKKRDPPPEPKSVEIVRSESPPVPSVRSKVILDKASSPPQLVNEAKPEKIFSSLAEIRRSIMQDQLNLKKDTKESYEVMNRRTVRDILDDFDDDLDNLTVSAGN